MSAIDSIINDIKNIKHEKENDGDPEYNVLGCMEYINKLYLYLEENEGRLYIHSSDCDDMFKYRWPGTVDDFTKLEKVFEKMMDPEIIPKLIISLFNIKTNAGDND